MEQRVSLITLGVKDLSQSQQFYERLGWRRSMAKTEGIVFFQVGGMALALYPRRELAKDANVSSEGVVSAGRRWHTTPVIVRRLTRFWHKLSERVHNCSSRLRKPFGEVIPDIFPI
jgi:hypothetical protein